MPRDESNSEEDDVATATQTAIVNVPTPVDVWGLPLAPMTFEQTLDAVEDLVARGEPSYFITANLRYAMLSEHDARLRAVNREAAFLVADGWPLVFASRRGRTPLPERVTGADLVPAMCARAAERGYRVFLLGGADGVGDEAARRLRERHPTLDIVGIEAPPFRPLSAEEEADLIGRVRAARPDILFVAFGQPRGELWLQEHVRALGVPCCVQIGASLDFLAARVRRAPRAVQRLGLEWAWRIAQEPARLGPRYAQDIAFLARKLVTRRR